MVWFNHTGLSQLQALASRFETEMKIRGEQKLRVFLVYMNPSYQTNDAPGNEILREKLRQWCVKQNLQRVALVCVPSPVDKETCGVFKINPEVKNTVFVYKKRVIVDKWININYDQQTMNKMLKSINTLQNTK